MSSGGAYTKSGKGFLRRCYLSAEEETQSIVEAAMKEFRKRESSRLNEIHIRLASRIDAEVQGIYNLKR